MVGVGGSFKREGIYAYMGLIHFIVQQTLTHHKAFILSKNKIKKIFKKI